MLKVKYNEYRAFERGMEQGACRLFGKPEDQARIVAIQNGMSTGRDTKAFVTGYTLAYSQDSYFYAWKDNKNLLFIAVRNCDVKPVGWKWTTDYTGTYIEELTK